MQHLHTVNYHNFSPNELCNYLDERYYTEISHNFETTQKYLDELSQNEPSAEIDLLIALFDKLHFEMNQLFVKDRILLFPNLVSPHSIIINLEPINIIHQRIIVLLQKIRELMNNYVQQPAWTSLHKICCNELYGLEQLIHHVLYIKENFLWNKINPAL